MKVSGKKNNSKNSRYRPTKNLSGVKTRKEIRKEKRQTKKAEKSKSYIDRIKKYKESNKPGKFVRVNNKPTEDVAVTSTSKLKISCAPKGGQKEKKGDHIELTDISKENSESKKDKKVLESQMKKQRKKLLLEANKEEDKIISSLEKQLRLNKRKSKSLPASFTASGLDYILDVCNPEKMKNMAEAEKYFQDSGSEFEDDLAMIKGKLDKKKSKKSSESNSDDDNLSENAFSDSSDMEKKLSQNRSKVIKKIKSNDPEMDSDEELSDNSLFDDLEGDDDSDLDDEDRLSDSDPSDEATLINTKNNSKPFNKKKDNHSKADFGSDSEIDNKEAKHISVDKRKGVKFNLPDSDSDGEPKGKFVLLKRNKKEVVSKKRKHSESGSDDEVNDETVEVSGDEPDSKVDETWEDIYGRKRDKQGNILEETKGKYIPPALRGQTLKPDDKKREVIERLRRQLKGLLNRLAENNMHSIASQIEELYMKNSRNDMNESMMSLYSEAIVTPVHTPERLIMEHAMLTAILHANIGTEVGAYMLQNFVTNFNKLLQDGTEIGDKRLDNLLTFICHLYSFKIFDNSLLYDILQVLCDKFKEKEVELLLVILRNVGFSLRKDDPLALKELVLRIQRLASEASSMKNDARVSFMLDILLKIKNNNMSKLPQYDPTHCEHLKKLLKTMIRKGNYVTELKISLEDLLKVEERGRWWIVGSAWTGHSEGKQEDTRQVDGVPTISNQLGQLAKKLRINTDIRKNIFGILMTAEDYNDAFEKLMKLGLKGQVMNDIIHVLLHCLLQEKEYNHYYALVGNRFCETDRRHRMVMQYSLWDKFKEVDEMKPFQVTNLAKLLAFLFVEGTLPLSVLKVIQLVEITKGNVRLIRQVLLSILYNKDEQVAANVFVRLKKSNKLHMFREGLRLFLHHFLLKNMKESDDDYLFLKERVEMADKMLQTQSY